MKGKYLVTTDSWFFAPDGLQYCAVYGDVQIVGDESLGLKTNRNSTNWYAMIGTEANHVIVAGCQIHYSVKCLKRPKDLIVEDYSLFEGKQVKSLRPSRIYFTD